MSLARAGYHVSFVVADDRFLTAEKDYATPEGVHIIAVKRRSGRFARMFITGVEIVAEGLRENGKIYHFHDPELIPAGLLLRLMGKRVIYDVHEDVPRDIRAKEWIPHFLRQPVALMATAVEWLAGRTLSGVAAATPVIAKRFPERRTAVVQNFALPSDEGSCDPENSQPGNAVAYVGGLKADRCIAELVEAVGLIEGIPDVRLLMAGIADPPNLLSNLMTLPGWSRVHYRGYQDRAGVIRLLSEASIGIALYQPREFFLESQPLKLFEYMAAGLPVITSNFPAFRALVEANRCGICVPPHDPLTIASAIEWMLHHPAEAAIMGQRGRELAKKCFSWEAEEKALFNFYERVTSRSS